MIDYIKSAELNNMGVSEFKAYVDKYPKSQKRVILVCDECGKERNSTMGSCHKLCRSCSQHKNWASKEMRDKQSKTTTEYYKSHPEARKKHSVRMKEYFKADPKRAEHHSETIKKYFSDPANAAAHSITMKKYYVDHPEAREAARLKAVEQWSNQDARRTASEIRSSSTAVMEILKNMHGGNDIIKHHYIYDNNDLSKYTTEMTRSNHAILHWNMRKSGIEVPHINIGGAI